jgi:hypothetical protein
VRASQKFKKLTRFCATLLNCFAKYICKKAAFGSLNLPIRPFTYTIAPHFAAMHIDDVIGAKSMISQTVLRNMPKLFFTLWLIPCIF